MDIILLEKVTPQIAKITLNDPDNLNAMSEKMAESFSQVVDTLKAEKPRVIILTGAGRAFSAGGDLEMLEAKTKLSNKENHKRMIQFYDSFLRILEVDTPIIAAINGHAVGAGLCVACACDIRVASKNAKLGFTFTKLGLHPGMAGTWFLPKVIGEAYARELLLTGRMINAEEAKQCGLVSTIVEEGESVNAALKIAEEILSSGPLATQQLVVTLRRGHESLATALQREADCQAVNYGSDEFKEGIRAIKEKRKANF